MKDKDLLTAHSQSILRWSREHGYGPQPCFECNAEIESWWSYCAMCGAHLAAGRTDGAQLK